MLSTLFSVIIEVFQPFNLLVVFVGSFVGIMGLAGTGINYPIYKKLLENGKKKYAFEIMQLAKEISEKAERLVKFEKPDENKEKNSKSKPERKEKENDSIRSVCRMFLMCD